MNVLAFASRKGGAGKSTLAAHLAVHVHGPTRPCLLIDDDPQGSLTLWNELRAEPALPLKIVKRGIAHIVKKAKRTGGVEWIFIDTPAYNSASAIEAIEAATLVVIPCRPGLFDIDAVQETIAFARQARTPFAVVFNAAPPKRQNIEAPAVTLARRCLAQLDVPVWAVRSPTAQVSRWRLAKAKVRRATLPIPARPPRSAACGQPSKSRSTSSAARAKRPPCTASRPSRRYPAALPTPARSPQHRCADVPSQSQRMFGWRTLD